MSWFKRNWKAVALAVATAVSALTADHTLGHRISDQVVKVMPLIPDDAPAAPAPAQP
jgi:hypothetical protein